MRYLAILVICAPLVLTSVAHAQAQNQSKKPSPEEMQESLDAAMNSMVPVMGRMAQVMIDAQLKIAARPETATSIAAFKRNLFLELQKKGFSSQEALQITLATALPTAPTMGK